MFFDAERGRVKREDGSRIILIEKHLSCLEQRITFFVTLVLAVNKLIDDIISLALHVFAIISHR